MERGKGCVPRAFPPLGKLWKCSEKRRQKGTRIVKEQFQDITLIVTKHKGKEKKEKSFQKKISKEDEIR